jgi:integrase
LARPRPKHRRPRGSGGLTKRLDGRWQASWGGKRRPFRERAEAEAWLAEQRAGVAATGPTAPSLGAYLTDWWSDREPLWRGSPGTLRTYRGRLALAAPIQATPLRELGHRACQAWLSGLLARGLAPRTVRAARSLLGRALEDAVPDLIISNPLRRTMLPHAPRRDPPAYDAEQARRLLECLRGDRFEALFAVALATGCRVGELRGLQWSDLDLESR